MSELPCDRCADPSQKDDYLCPCCKGNDVMYEVMIVKTPDGSEYVTMGWDKSQAKYAFGDNLEILHLRAYPKE